MRISDWSSDVCSSDLGVRGAAGRGGDDRRIVGWPLVNDSQPRVDRRAMLGVDRAIDGGREHDAAMLLKPNEGRRPRRRVGREAGARDRDESATVAKTRERGRSEEHTSELQSLMRNSYAVFCLKKKNAHKKTS